MLGGRLYDAATLNQVAPVAAKRPAYWWAPTGATGAQGESGAGLGWSIGEASSHGHGHGGTAD